MNILLAVMGQSPYNRSIWTGLGRGFRALGHHVIEVDAEQVPEPTQLDRLPELFFAVHGANLPVERVRQYRDSGVTTCVYLLDEPYEVDRSLTWSHHYDWVFSVDNATVPLHAEHTNAAHLPLAFDDQIFTPHGKSHESSILLLGSPFKAREEILGPLRDRWGRKITWVGPGWKAFCKAGHHFEGFASPQDCAIFYRGAKIVLNIHRDSIWSHFGELNSRHITATHLNPRFWEASGCGAFQLTSYRKDIKKYSRKSVTFSTLDNLENKLEYFLGNERARNNNIKLVQAGIRKHTYTERAAFILESTNP